eukprot:TRINITY_DN6492_c0_g2_i1.p1 TRINITY_DN6492_c0_g2~~TRINITY_DN6492_c0_g2_i1.p1  ORF type:complete len:558 (-),score=59.94 TRINITY_DN6492_c0_g2_i1:71-1744(-)
MEIKECGVGVPAPQWLAPCIVCGENMTYAFAKCGNLLCGAPHALSDRLPPYVQRSDIIDAKDRLVEYQSINQTVKAIDQAVNHIPSYALPEVWIENRARVITECLALYVHYYTQRRQIHQANQSVSEGNTQLVVPPVRDIDEFKQAVLNAELDSYSPLHPDLYRFDKKWLSDEAQAAMDDPSRIMRSLIIRRECPTVASIALFTSDYCRLMVQEFQHLKESLPYAPLDYKGLYLDLLQFGPFFEELTKLFNKWLHVVHPRITIEYTHCSVVHYSFETSPTKGHPLHVDLSDLTMNLALGPEFTGSEVLLTVPQLRSNRDPSEYHSKRAAQIPLNIKENADHPPMDSINTQLSTTETTTYEYTQQVGRALFHPGSIVHSTSDITSGQRWNIVVWWSAHCEFHLFTQLPTDVQLFILSYLSVSDIGNIAQCSRYMHALTESNLLWHTLYTDVFGATKNEEAQALADERAADKPAITAPPNARKRLSIAPVKRDEIEWRFQYYKALQKILDMKHAYNWAAEPRVWAKARPAPRHGPPTAMFVPTLGRQYARSRDGRCYIQ